MVYQRKWHVVIIGTKPGVYSSWIEAGPKTRGIPGGAIFQSFPSKAEADRAFKAAKERGEVKAYPNGQDQPFYKSKKPPPTPPSLGEEAALLRTPLLWKLEPDAESTGLQTSLSIPSRSRVENLKRILQDPTDACSASSSPPTGITQVYAPLYEEDDNTRVVRSSPHFTFTSSSSRAYPSPSRMSSSGLGAEKAHSRHEVSNWGLPSSMPLSLDSCPGAEEHTSRLPRCMPLHPEPPSRSAGVEYRSLPDLADTESIDSRIWFPESRIFHPDKVKPRPLTRPPSPAKRATCPVPGHETVGDNQGDRSQISPADTPFVRAGRGRHSRLAPSLSLPVLPNQGLEVNYLTSGLSHPTQLLENHWTDNAKIGEIDHSEGDKRLAERPAMCPSNMNYGRSHVQLVPCDCRNAQSVVVVHCPPNCLHATCYSSQLVSSVRTTEPSKPDSSRYIDASVSPIFSVSCGKPGTDSPAKIGSTRHLKDDHPCELAGSMHVSQRAMTPEADVRSPFTKSTMVPMNVAKVLFGRPSPPLLASNVQAHNWVDENRDAYLSVFGNPSSS